MRSFRGNFLGNDPSTSQMEEVHLNIKGNSQNLAKLKVWNMYRLDWAFVSTNAYETDLWIMDYGCSKNSGHDLLNKWPASLKYVSIGKRTNLHDSASKRPHDATCYHQ